jgi:hypothetical protein
MKPIVLFTLCLLSSGPVAAQEVAANTGLAPQVAAPHQLHFSAEGLPPGLTIDPATGVITGRIDRAASRGTSGIFDILVNIDSGDGASGQSRLRIALANAAPIASDDNALVVERTTGTIMHPLDNDVDADGDELSIRFGSADHGTVVVSGTKDLAYFPQADFSGNDRISYGVSDGHGGTATGMVHVTVRPDN